MEPLTLLSSLTPPAQTRAWFSAPHPHLPLLATCSSDRSVRIYSLATFRLHSTVEGGHKRSVRACAWKPGQIRGESVLATGSFDASAGIWRRWDHDLVPKQEEVGDEGDAGVDTEEARRGGGRRIRDVEDDEGQGDEDDDEWRFAVVLDGHESEIKSVAWSAGGNFLATCSRDKSVWVWEEIDDDNFETIAVLQEHEADVKCVVWHPEEEVSPLLSCLPPSNRSRKCKMSNVKEKLLASSSYDDTIRLYREDIDDWTCIALLTGHDSTVWAISFEPVSSPQLSRNHEVTPSQQEYLSLLRSSGPRLISCSADQTIRVWRRIPKNRDQNSSASTSGSAAAPGKPMPSIIRPMNAQSIEEDWTEEAVLPQRHERAILSVAWSPWSGRVVSTGGDGKIIVYEERWADGAGPSGNSEEMDTASDGQSSRTKWTVVSEREAAHGVFEINHVCWAKRFDGKYRQRKRQRDGDDPVEVKLDEEMIVSTGDDGAVRAWVVGAEDGDIKAI
ncbi:MAG: hypothetical protein M4579_001186 [Chaenotheca gracillima]|nr:MAG: hypothetical protein M4579_001186 [Chaenotheca gracillima]